MSTKHPLVPEPRRQSTYNQLDFIAQATPVVVAVWGIFQVPSLRVLVDVTNHIRVALLNPDSYAYAQVNQPCCLSHDGSGERRNAPGGSGGT